MLMYKIFRSFGVATGYYILLSALNHCLPTSESGTLLPDCGSHSVKLSRHPDVVIGQIHFGESEAPNRERCYSNDSHSSTLSTSNLERIFSRYLSC